jgi:hypothetical protein
MGCPTNRYDRIAKIESHRVGWIKGFRKSQDRVGRSTWRNFRTQAMTAFFHRLRVWLFPPVSRRKAFEIALLQYIPARQAFRVCGSKPANVNIYGLPEEPCWFVYGPWNEGKDGMMLRSSRIILVSKVSGQVLYDGPAGDEG